MSRILRRPMFRGGKVIDSRGTGITSGLMNTPSYATGGRVGFSNGGSFLDIFKGADTRGYGDIILGGQLYPNTSTTDILGMKDYIGTSRNILDQQKPVKIGTDEDIVQKTTEEIFAESKAKKDADAAKAKEMGVDVDTMKAIERENLRTGSVKDQVLEKTIANQPNLSKSTGEVKTQISAKDLIRENAELFKELLNEGQKEDIKKARIQDASDYLLKFFEGTQKEGATVGSAAADVAGFATSKPSATERAKEAAKKTDQTAVALAINDYVAGKRSKEDITKAISLAAATAKVKEGDIADQLLEISKRQTLTGGKIKQVLGARVGKGEGKGIRTIPTGQENNYKPGPEDEGFFIFEEATKNIFKFEDGVLKPIFRPG
jgi:hypothetical protein